MNNGLMLIKIELFTWNATPCNNFISDQYLFREWFDSIMFHGSVNVWHPGDHRNVLYPALTWNGYHTMICT